MENNNNYAPELKESQKVIVYMSEENPLGVDMEVSNDGENWKKEKILFYNKELFHEKPFCMINERFAYARPIEPKKQISISEAEKILNELSKENFKIIS